MTNQQTVSRRGFCLCCLSSTLATCGGWLSPREVFAKARNIVDLIRHEAARAPTLLVLTITERESSPMTTITTKDSTEIYYKDWGKGPVITFSHGWPLNADAWDGQMLFLEQNGY